MTADRTRPVCGATTEVEPLLPPAERGLAWPTVHVCAREPNHGGNIHEGPPLHTWGAPPLGAEPPIARWRVEPPAPVIEPRPARARDHDRHHGLDAATGPYRVGRDCPWNVYRQLTDDAASKDDPSLFDAGNADLAARVVDALNAHRHRPGPGMDMNTYLGELIGLIDEARRDRNTQAQAAADWEERAGWASGVLVGLRRWAKEMATAAHTIRPQEILDRIPDDDRDTEPPPHPVAIPDAPGGGLTDAQLAALHEAAEIGYDVRLSARTLRALLARLDDQAADMGAARVIFGRVRSALSRLTHDAREAERYDADHATAAFADLLRILTTDPTPPEPDERVPPGEPVPGR